MYICDDVQTVRAILGHTANNEFHPCKPSFEKAVCINHAPAHRSHRPLTVREIAVGVNILSTNFYSLEIVYSHCVRCVTVVAPRKRHFVVYCALSWHFGQLRRE